MVMKSKWWSEFKKFLNARLYIVFDNVRLLCGLNGADKWQST